MSTASSPAPTSPDPEAGRKRAPFVPPSVEALGTLSILTLQQSVPIGPGSDYPGVDRSWWPA